MALPVPASIFMFDDLVEEAFFEARSARACIQMLGIAAEEIMASAQNPMPLRDWPHPEFVGQSMRSIQFACYSDTSIAAAVARSCPDPTTTTVLLFYDLPE
jgi:hypothetical protein